MKGYEVGADDYIAKPFNPNLLLARVKAYSPVRSVHHHLHIEGVSKHLGLMVGFMKESVMKFVRQVGTKWRYHRKKLLY